MQASGNQTRPRLKRGLRSRRRKGRVLAVKWGLNPNSSSLGVDVTFLLFGATALAIATPVVSALVRLRLAGKNEIEPQDAQSDQK